MRCVVLLWAALAWMCASAHDDYLPLQQPEVIESPCVKRWNDMAAHFQSARANDLDTNRTTRTRPLAFENEPSELQVNLTVQMDRFESRYVGFNTRTYNGKVPAPTIKVCPGDRLMLRIANELGDGDANMTNVHLHGLHVSPKGHADNVLANILPGAARIYDYQIRSDHPSGTFWYHPHSHGIVNTQLSGLMAGALIVVDRPGDFPEEISKMDDLVLILQAICVENCHTTYDCIVNALKNDYDSNSSTAMGGMDMSDMSDMDIDSEEEEEEEQEPFPVDLRVDRNSPLNDTSLLHAYVNGQYLPEVHMKPGEFKRLRYLNAIANNVAELIAPDCDVYVLAMDGIYWEAPVKRGVVVIPPGGRADLAVMCKNAGTFFMETESSPKRNHLLGRINQHRVPSQKVVSLRVIGEERVEMTMPSALPKLPTYMQSSIAEKLSAIPSTNKYNYEFSVWMDEKNAMTYGVNKQKFEHHFVNYSMRVDEPQEWELSVKNYGNHHCDETPVEEMERRDNINFSTESHLLHAHSVDQNDKMKDVKHACHTMNHPFHMHASHFQITSRDAAADPDNILFGIGEWRDTIPLFKTQVQIRFTPQDHMIGRILTHCHVASHSDGGMAQLVEVLPSKDTR
uniref:Plastocyanin-like domain-containing protein n=1 Tax=Globisporangium ultimum (strain ATCC 200006 / CBS 805.95 / DAOM BR144) TaxID=431595 RepID=K3X0T5_GLOUD